MEIKKYQKNLQNFYCEKCYYNTCKQNDFVKNKTTRKHLANSLEINGNEKVFSINSGFTCSQCNYTTSIKSNYDKHLTTDKHKKNLNGESKKIKYICSQCDKEYMNSSGLWKHKKQCSPLCRIYSKFPLKENKESKKEGIKNGILVEEQHLVLCHHIL